MKKIIKNIKSMLRNKSGKVSLSESIEDDIQKEEYTQDESEIEDIILNIAFLPANLVYWTGKGIYIGIKKISEIYQKYKGK